MELDQRKKIYLIYNGYVIKSDNTMRYYEMLRNDSNGAESWTISAVRNERTVYRKGTYILDAILDLGSVPEGECAPDGYWYEFVKPASDSRVMIDGIWKDANESYACVNGILRPVDEIKVCAGGIWK